MSTQPTVADLQRICRQRGARLTEQRKEAFKELRKVGKPITAYDFLPKMEQRLGKRLAPLTVYRALDFLVEHGLVHKIASNHSYALCDRPHVAHESLHLVCSQCGAGDELPLGDINQALTDAAATLGFVPDRSIVEMEGRCRDCA